MVPTQPTTTTTTMRRVVRRTDDYLDFESSTRIRRDRPRLSRFDRRGDGHDVTTPAVEDVGSVVSCDVSTEPSKLTPFRREVKHIAHPELRQQQLSKGTSHVA